MPTPPLSDPLGALNQVLSELIDLVADVKQAHRKVPSTDVLHSELDQLFDDLRAWLGLLMDQDAGHGVSPLAEVTTAAGRSPVNLWSGNPDDEEVRAVLAEHLGRLEQHAAEARDALAGDPSGPVLADIAAGIELHVQRLRP